MAMLEEFGEAETYNFRESQKALESYHRGAIETMEFAGDLFEALAEEFTAHCRLPEAQAEVNAWLESIDGPAEQLVALLEQAELVGSIDSGDPAKKAKEGIATAWSDYARTLLIMRLHRDYVFGLADLLRLRLTPAIGYLRLQSETIGLLSLFTEDERLALDWMNLVKGGGKEFFQRTQSRLREKLRSLGLDSYYEQGSEWALHSRVFGLAGGVANAPDEGPGTVSLSYQELGGDTEGLFTWVWYYLDAHKKFAMVVVGELPELRETNGAREKCDYFSEKLESWVERKRWLERLKGR